MPIEGLIDHPLGLTLPAAGHGILMRLVMYFWNTECRAMPICDRELRSISRSHGPTWRKWRLDVLQVFNDVKPELEQYYQARKNKWNGVNITAAKGAAALRAKKLLSEQTMKAADSIGAALPKRKQENVAAEVAAKEGFQDAA